MTEHASERLVASSPRGTTERWALAIALFGAPVLYLTAQVLLVLMPREGSLFSTLAAHSELWLISHILLTAWLVLLIPSVAALGKLLGASGWPYRMVGVTLASIGIVVNGLITGVDFVLGAISPMNEAVATSVHEHVVDGVLAPLDFWDTALPLGLLILTIGLYRTRAAPQWMVLLLLAGLAIPSLAEIRLVPAAIQLLGFACIAVFFVRRGADDSRGTYAHPVVGAFVAAVVVLPGALFSVERVAFATLAVAVLVVPELWKARRERRER